jgi:hypothetical protein
MNKVYKRKILSTKKVNQLWLNDTYVKFPNEIEEYPNIFNNF